MRGDWSGQHGRGVLVEERIELMPQGQESVGEGPIEGDDTATDGRGIHRHRLTGPGLCHHGITRNGEGQGLKGIGEAGLGQHIPKRSSD